MSRSAQLVPAKTPRSRVAFTLVRAFAEPAKPAPAAGAATASPRVRDSLVLRVVSKKSDARSSADERRSR